MRGEDEALDKCLFIQPSAGLPAWTARGEERRSVDPDLTPLAAREALDRMRELTGLHAGPECRETTEALARRPLALAQAAAMICREHLSFAEYTARLRASAIESAASARGTVDQSLAAPIVLNLESLTDHAPSTADVAATLSVFASARGVDFRLLQRSVNPHDTLSLDGALDLLSSAALTKAGPDATSVTMHPHIQRVIREWSRQRGSLLAAAEGALHALRVEFDAYAGNIHTEPLSMIRFSEHIDALWAAVAPSVSGPDWVGLVELMELRAWQISQPIRMMTATDLGAAGMEVAAAASTAGEELSADCDRLLGPGHPTTRRARNYLVHAYRAMGHHDRACALLAKNLRHVDRADDNAPEALAMRHDLGLAHLEAGRPKRAQQIRSDVLARRQQALGTDHPETCETRQLLDTARSISR